MSLTDDSDVGIVESEEHRISSAALWNSAIEPDRIDFVPLRMIVSVRMRLNELIVERIDPWIAHAVWRRSMMML